MSYSDQQSIVNDKAFQWRVRQALVDEAIDVSTEAASAHESVDRARLALAREVLRDNAKMAALFTYAMAAKGIDTDATDAQLKNAVAVGWNAFAGTNPNIVRVEPAAVPMYSPQPPAPRAPRAKSKAAPKRWEGPLSTPVYKWLRKITKE